MESLSENAQQALTKIVIVKNEADVFAILDDYNIDHFEGQILLNIFHESDSHRKKAIEEIDAKKLQLKIERLKKKHEHLRNLTDNHIEVFYEHLLHEKKTGDIFNTRYDHLAIECSNMRKIKRRQMKKQQLEEKFNISIDVELPREVHWGTDEYQLYMLQQKTIQAFNCLKCEHLLECNC